MAARIVTLALICAVSVLLAPVAVEAQAGKGVRVGVLRPAPEGPEFWDSGGNARPRSRAGAAQRDAILAVSPAAVTAAVQATKFIPIVAIDLESDPKASGFAASLAHPGGNVTGLFLDVPELSGKWIELLKEVVPNLARIAVVTDRATGPYYRNELEAAARALRVQTLSLDVRGPEDFAGAFRAAATERAGALLVLPSPVVNSARKRIAELATKHRLPAIMPFAGFVDDGGLLAYGPDILALYEQAGGIVAKVLREPDRLIYPSSGPHVSS